MHNNNMAADLRARCGSARERVEAFNMAVDSRCGYYLQQAEEETFQNNKFLNKCLGPGLQRHAVESSDGDGKSTLASERYKTSWMSIQDPEEGQAKPTSMDTQLAWPILLQTNFQQLRLKGPVFSPPREIKTPASVANTRHPGKTSCGLV